MTLQHVTLQYIYDIALLYMTLHCMTLLPFTETSAVHEQGTTVGTRYEAPSESTIYKVQKNPKQRNTSHMTILEMCQVS